MAALPGWNRLRVRLLALVMVALVPASALFVQSNFERRRSETRHVREETLRLARLAARDHERLFEETRRVLIGIASHPDVRSGDPGRCAKLLSVLLMNYPQYGNFSVYDAAGQLTCSAKPTSGAVSVADRTYFREALRTHDFSIGDYMVGRITRRPNLSFGYPILDARRQPISVVATALDLEWLNIFAAEAKLPSNVVVLVVDSRRVILARVPDGATWTGRRVPDQSGVASVLDGGEGAADAKGPDGVQRLYGVSHIGSGRSRLAVAVGMPLDVLNEADRTLYSGLALLGLIGLITAGLAWTGLEAFVVRPLNSLRAATHRLASADLSGRAMLRSGIQELDTLGRDFDDMANALQQREAEERRAREAREEVEEKYRHLIEQSLVGVYLIQASNVLYVNPRCAEIFGYTVDELLATSLLDLVHDADRPMVAENVARRLSGELSAMNYSFRGKRKDGTLVTVHVHGARTIYRGQPAITGILIDQTEQKVLEQQLQHSQKMEAVGRLAGGVAHDFNNLLTVIQGYGEFLRQQLPSSSPERDHVDEILKASDSASNLTRQLLAFSRHQVMQPEIISLNKVVADFDKMVRRLIGEDIRVNLRLDPDLALLKVDPGQIEQVILNLAVNARDAMPNGGTLTIQTANTSLDEHYVRLHPGAQAGPHVMLAVSDTGIGMTPETQARVFEPFFTTKERGKGTGLGLSTVYGIVKQSGGSIWLYSEVGRGTTFKIFLPLADAGIVIASAVGVRRDGVGGTETVAVVEDDNGVRVWISEALKQLGYDVLPLESPLEALDMANRREDAIDLLLTDVVLPNLNGPDLAARLKKRWPAMKVLYVSGCSDEAMLPQGLLGEADRVLQKPFTASALGERVRETLDRVDKNVVR